jgi:flagellar basal body-associated protein FliL
MTELLGLRNRLQEQDPQILNTVLRLIAGEDGAQLSN